MESSIQSHRLVYADWSPDSYWQEIDPAIIICHYTVSRNVQSTINSLRARSESCHLICARDGSMTQMVPFNMRAAHAGISEWQGRQRCNGFSVGIEIVNPGPVFPDEHGGWVDVYSKPWTGEVYSGRHRNAGWGWTHWAAYSDEQIDAVIRVCAELLEAYPSIVDVVGHDDVAPSRKADPGPHWPWGAVRSALRLPQRGSTERAPPPEDHG